MIHRDGNSTLPDIRRLDLNMISVLHALLTERNLTRAGERVGLSHPAVSAALGRLRQIYGDQLLVREGRGFVLTGRAEALLPVISEALAGVDHTFELVPEFDPMTITRTFLISASDYVLSELTAPLLTLFDREAPHANIQFAPLPMSGTISPTDLLRRDVIVAATRRGIPGRQRSLFSDRFVCVADASNPALEDGSLSLESIASLRHVRSVFGASTPIDDMLKAAGIAPRQAVAVEGFLAVPFSIRGTSWIGWVPERVASRFAGRLGVVIVRTPITPSVLVEAAYWHPSKTSDLARRWLVHKLRQASELVEFGPDDMTSPSTQTA